MKIVIENPIEAYIVESTHEEMEKLKSLLTYTNTANQYLLKRHSKNTNWRFRNEETWQARTDELKASIRKTLVYNNGTTFIRPASIPYIQQHFDLTVENKIVYPTLKMVPWAKPLPFELYDYQKESAKGLIEEKHGSVELTTGSGKSMILLKICRDSGLKTAIIAPSRSIFNELVEKFELHLGKNNVGKFGDGKKVLGKRFTICIGDSLVNIKKDSKEWEFFHNLDMLVVDESHEFACETLEVVCHGVLAKIPYRIFLSATQIRNSGDTKLLQSIIGKNVYSLNTKDAVEQGFICPHEFRIVSIGSSNPNYTTHEVLDMKRVHLYRNKNIANFIAKLANAEATLHKRQTLILVEELGQIASLIPLLKVPVAIAHSEKKSDRLIALGLEKVDPSESVAKFNKAEAMVLIGTSCIATGTNIFPTHNTINWVGGASEIKTKQGSVGRSVRLHKHNPNADKCILKDKAIIWDFNVYDIDVLTKHLEDRISFYLDSGSPIKYVRLK